MEEKKMYNHNWKLEFICEREAAIETPVNYLKRWFLKTADFEEKYEKDVCCFTYYEIIDMYKSFSLTSLASLQILNSHLAIYADWCFANHIITDSQNHFREVKKENLMDCMNVMMANKKIVDRSQLKQWINCLQNPSDAFIFLALFEGIGGKLHQELTDLEVTDFTDNGTTITVKLCTGREMEVSRELYNLAIKSANKLEYIVESKEITFINEPNKIIKVFPYIETNEQKAKARRITARLDKVSKFLGIDSFLTSSTLKESGKIAYILKLKEETGKRGKENAAFYKTALEHQYGCKYAKINVFYEKYKKYLE